MELFKLWLKTFVGMLEYTIPVTLIFYVILGIMAHYRMQSP